MSDMIRRLRARGGLVLALVGLAAGPVAGLATLDAGSALAARHHGARHQHHASHHRRSHGCIPQHGRGDGDADNFGGPSDGDGCQ